MEYFENEDRLTKVEVKLAQFLAEQIENSSTYFGYPEIPQNNDLSILGISGLAKLHLNNAGDPNAHGNAKMHTKAFEKEVLEFVAKLYNLEDFWGYITSGGTEGNLFGMYMGRDYFVQQDKTPYFLYAESSHYSIPKNAHLLNLNAVKVNNNKSGEMSYDSLEKNITNIVEKDKSYGLIININFGTTMTGAIDKLSLVNKVIEKLNIDSKRVHIHVDAALMGFIYPFLDNKEDIFKMGAKSIAISGHKFPGTIHPCGVILAEKQSYNKAFNKSNWIPYLDVVDTTISGSRNGFLALNFWYIIQKKGVEGFKKEAKDCIDNAVYLYKKLKEINYPDTEYIPNQIIVTFKKPSLEIIKKYQLATEKTKAHVVVMQHVNKSRIDKFCELLEKDLDK